jgi:hypothetical protein
MNKQLSTGKIETLVYKKSILLQGFPGRNVEETW